MDKINIIPAKNDVIFRNLFGDERNKEFLVGFLESILGLTDDDLQYFDYDTIEYQDTEQMLDHDFGNEGLVIIRLRTTYNKLLRIELHSMITPPPIDRIVYYTSRLITLPASAGEEHKRVNRAICIIITDGTLINSTNYHNRFTLFSNEAKEELTGLMEIHSLELSKLPLKSDRSKLYDWAKFFSAASEDELKTLTKKNPTIGRACKKLIELSCDEKLRI
ncbi:MAG: Rpn family recombination-promoting nuclease/putative transposase [Christensenellaceae bacterium]|jgi:predicted transposase/invertase (TIGR01784 family)|nr:Rpn family recombination-promoting nuclease/putative transposase [Christensenellaceae bacterium]